ncbi:MAG: HD-GYP domain-containing protein [Spirochaetes bacterium]|nr:HD-GYP domain-containing protein [Spirochaetota bacterium]
MVFENENNINLTDIEISTLNIISSNLNLFFHTFYFHQKIENDLLNTLKALVSSIEIKDHYTKGHSLRVMNYAIKFAFLLNLEDKIIEKIKWASLLHDIGKIGIPESILNKTLPLSENEFIIMKKHVFFSYQILQPLSFLEEERKIILHHHEKWDGTGYPYGLKGEEIPFESRIISIVDSFDAMNTNRPYRKKVNMDYIKNQFIENLGKQFDPILGEKFIQFLENKDIVAENLIS